MKEKFKTKHTFDKNSRLRNNLIFMSHFNDSLFMFLDNHYTELVIISGNEPYEINYLFDPQTKKGAFQFISKSENSEDMEYTEGIPDQILYNEFLKGGKNNVKKSTNYRWK